MEKTRIELYENSNQLLNASIDKIIVELIKKKNDSVDARSQMIVLTGCSPLAGTTSLSIAIAIAMAQTGRKTILIDCDVRKSVRYKKLNDNVKTGLANYLSNKGKDSIRLDDVIYDTNIESLSYVPCGESSENPTRILCSERMDDFLNNLKNRFDYVILDFPSFAVVPDAEIMFGKCDGIITVAALGETKRSQIKDARRLIAKFQDKYYGMIINKSAVDIIKANIKNYDYYLVDKFGKQHFERNFLRRKNKKSSTGKKNQNQKGEKDKNE